MSVIPRIETFADELTEIRHDLHAHPELGFEETRTAGIVAEKLRAYGLDEVHEGIGGTGVVGVLRGNGGGNRLAAPRGGVGRSTALACAAGPPGHLWSIALADEPFFGFSLRP